MGKKETFKVIHKIDLTEKTRQMWHRRTVVLNMKGYGQWRATKEECYPSTLNEIIAEAVDKICEIIDSTEAPMSVTDCTLISHKTEEIGVR